MKRESAFGFPFTVDPGAVRYQDNMAVQAVNTGHFARVRDAGRISKIGVGIATQGGNISVAVYRNSGTGRNSAPGTRLATSGSIVCPAAGWVEIALDKALWVHRGDWLAISADNTTATFRTLLAIGADSDMGKGRQCRQATAHPLPATASGLVATAGYTFVLVGA